MTPQETAFLAQIGRPGWTIVGRQPAEDKNPLTAAEWTNSSINPAHFSDPYPAKVPSGNETWSISDGKGNNQTLVVKPPDAGASGNTAAGTNVQWPTDASGAPTVPPSTYTVVTPPEPMPAAATKTDAAPHTITQNGVVYQLGADGKTWAPAVPGMTGPKAATPLSGYVPIKNDRNETVRLVDPNDPTKSVDIPVGASPSKPSTISGARGAIYSWDGSNLSQLVAGDAAPSTAKDGDTRRNVINGMAVTEKYSGGSWATDPSVPATSFDPTKPKDGDVRPNTDNKGQKIQEVYKGGSWVTDTSVNPSPFGPQIPTTVATNAADATIVQRNPTTGAIETVPNPNYRPTDTGSRVQQLQAQASAKRQDLQTQTLNGSITADEAQRQWGDFWANQIEPQRQAVQAAESQTTFNNNITAQNAGMTAGNAAVKDAMDTLPYRVGPQMGADFAKGLNTLSSGGGAVNFSPGDFSFDMPDFETIRHQATAHALKDISPYAASQIGAPTPQVPAGVDVNGLLNQTNYGGSFASAPPAAAPSPDPAAVVHAAVSAALQPGTYGPQASGQDPYANSASANP